MSDAAMARSRFAVPIRQFDPASAITNTLSSPIRAGGDETGLAITLTSGSSTACSVRMHQRSLIA